MKRLITALCLLFILGCNEKTIEKPENLIPKDQMIEIFYDLAIINAAKKTNSVYLIDNNIEPMPFIYGKYDVDSLQFVHSDIYYASVPEEYEAMYKVVEARLESEKSEYDKTKTKVSDSVRREAEKQRTKLKREALERKKKDSISQTAEN